MISDCSREHSSCSTCRIELVLIYQSRKSEVVALLPDTDLALTNANLFVSIRRTLKFLGFGDELNVRKNTNFIMVSM